MKDFVESSWGSISDEPLLQGTASQLTLEQDYKLCVVEINKFMGTICTQKIDASAFGTKTPDHFNDYVKQLSNAMTLKEKHALWMWAIKIHVASSLSYPYKYDRLIDALEHTWFNTIPEYDLRLKYPAE